MGIMRLLLACAVLGFAATHFYLSRKISIAQDAYLIALYEYDRALVDANRRFIERMVRDWESRKMP